MMHKPTDLMIRETIDGIEAKRGVALASFAAALDALAEANRAAAATTQRPDGHAVQHAASVLIGEKYIPSGEEPRAFALEHHRRGVDANIWAHLVDMMGLERIMDRTARDELRKSLADNPPPATAANCRATFEQLMGDSGMILRRGIAKAFSGLDRRFRSHDGFKVGARIVLSYAFSEHGGWHRNTDEVLRDVERAFYVLDGKEQPDRMGGIVGLIDGAKRGPNLTLAAFKVENDYFRVNGFKNGNCHVWFKRDDLVERVNLMLAEYYGAALGVAPENADVKHAPRTGMARNFGLFETPEGLAQRVRRAAGIHDRDSYSGDYPRVRVLEPSAGRGRIALPALMAGHSVTCVEVQPGLVADLRAAGLRVIGDDFLNLTPDRLGKFDAIAMNPPFDGLRDIDHVSHAFSFLAPGGQLAAIMSASVEFREDRKAVDFRAFVERLGGRFEDLPPGSFAESGTNVNTVLCTFRAPRA